MRLTLQNVTKTVGEQTYLYGVDLDLAPGSFNMLLGPTQAGKTSLLRLMAGLDYPSSGTIRGDGADVTLLGVRKRNVAMVYQEFVNYPSFTVYENIAAPVRRANARYRCCTRSASPSRATVSPWMSSPLHFHTGADRSAPASAT